MAKRVVVDLDKWRANPEQAPRCSYFYHPLNDGLSTLREIAAFEHYCRRCELACCIESCPRSALEKDARGVVVRHNLRCIRCMSCAAACPFGTILEEALRFHAGGCDYCEPLGEDAVPSCVESSTGGVLEYREVAPDEENVVLVGEKLAVRGRLWQKDDVAHKAPAGVEVK
jgi:Fe-S-cluster-containing dehydrogenase component